MSKSQAQWLQPLKHVASINDEALGENTDPDYQLQYIDIGNVDSSGEIREIATYTFADAPSRARRIVREGDVIISTVRTYLQAIAPIESPPDNLIVSTGFAVVRPNTTQLDSNYCKFALREPNFLYEVVKRSTGINYPAINSSELGNIPIYVPTLSDQKAIAEYLSQETAKIDGLIVAKERLLKLLDEKRRALITHAVTHGLNPNAPLRDSGIEWLGKIPAHWEVVSFVRYLQSLIDYRGKTPEKSDTGILLVTARNIRSGYIDYEVSQEYIHDDIYDEAMSRGKPKVGDLLFTTEAPLGQAALVDREDIALAQRVIKLNYDQNILLNEFVMYWILSSPFQWHLNSLSTGSTAIGIKASKLSELCNVIPSLSEQVNIVSYIKHQEQKLSQLSSVTKNTISLLNERRNSLIAAAVTGQLHIS